MASELHERRVLIIGGSGGIGTSLVRLFAEAGAQVTVSGRSPDRIEAVATKWRGTAKPLDILDNNAIEAFFAGEEPFDHVVIAAAATKVGSVAALPLDDAADAMESKFWGAYRVARAARIVDGGSITFISGFLSIRPAANAVLQGSINAALEALGRRLALERAPVRVNTVSPGVIDTPLWRALPQASREDFLGRTASALPTRRIGQPEDVARAVLFVATNPFATGTTVVVDGGGTIA
jgi:NAD(P)-dependent dehydrogenase (short-subunit alcohol dehydrogenase family)